MKKILLLAVAAALTLTANAYDFMVDGLCYNINNDSTSVTVTYINGGGYNWIYEDYLPSQLIIPSSVTVNHKSYSVTAIGPNALSQCSFLTSVTIPNSVTLIDLWAFSSCTGLTSLTIPSSVKMIDNQAFRSCSGLTNLVVENGNTKYDSRDNCNAIIETANNTIFLGCKNTSIPNSVTSIGDYAFYGCSELTSLTIPNTVISIGEYAFEECFGLSTVVMGKSVKTIGSGAFWECGINRVDITDLEAWCKIDFASGSSNPFYDEYGYGGNLKNLYLNGEKVTDLVIPESVTSIGGNAFCYCTGLTSVTIPNSVTSIGGYAFWHCRGLTSLTIPNSVTSIGSYSFYGCSGLTSITIPNSVTEIGHRAFSGCIGLTSLTLIGNGSWNYLDNMPSTNSLETLNIGRGITSLGNFGFASDTINSYAEIPPTCSSGTFSYYDSELHVPTTSISAYFTASYWQNFNNLANDLNEMVTLDKENASLAQWETLALIATVAPEECEVLWSSSNPSVAIVDENGLVTATGGGECDIFAILVSNPAVYACCHISSSYPEISLSLSEEAIEMILGDEYELTAIVIPDNTGLTPTWSSSDTSVATVENGLVKSVAEGECDITVTVLDKTATCHITVSYPEITISLSEEALEMNIGNEYTLTATISPDNIGLAPTWSSSNTNVASVDSSGKITAIADGECDITATVLDKTATCHVTVTNNVTISLNIENAIIGASQMLTVYPSCTPDVPVELVVTSSDPSVALVRLVNRTNAPAAGLKSFPEKWMALALMEELTASSETKAPALASTKAIMIVGAQNGTATITVTTVDGMAVPAVLELRVVDVDGDRTITASDITQIYNYMLNNDMTYYDTSDINGDGNITASDITELYNLLLGN